MAKVETHTRFFCSECFDELAELSCDIPGCFSNMHYQNYIQCTANMQNEQIHYCQIHSDNPPKQIELLPWDEEDEKLANG